MKIILILSVFVLNTYGFSQEELKQIYKKEFQPTEHFVVKEIDEYYFILSSTKSNNRKNILPLVSKGLLLKHYQKKDLKIEELKLQAFVSSLTWNKKDRTYLLSFIKKEKVKPIYRCFPKETNSTLIINKIKILKNIKNKTIQTHQSLKKLYFLNKDMKNYNKEVNLLMELKFNDF